MRKRVYIFSFIFFLIDFITKLIIQKSISLNNSISIIPNFFNLTYVLNDGAAFSILRGKNMFLIIMGIVVAIGIIYYLRKETLTNYKVVYYSLLIGGLFGNLIDRINYNAVRDFLEFNIFGINFPIFNLADAFICISIGLIIVEGIKGELNGNKSN